MALTMFESLGTWAYMSLIFGFIVTTTSLENGGLHKIGHGRTVYTAHQLKFEINFYKRSYFLYIIKKMDILLLMASGKRLYAKQ